MTAKALLHHVNWVWRFCRPNYIEDLLFLHECDPIFTGWSVKGTSVTGTFPWEKKRTIANTVSKDHLNDVFGVFQETSRKSRDKFMDSYLFKISQVCFHVTFQLTFWRIMLFVKLFFEADATLKKSSTSGVISRHGCSGNIPGGFWLGISFPHEIARDWLEARLASANTSLKMDRAIKNNFNSNASMGGSTTNGDLANSTRKTMK